MKNAEKKVEEKKFKKVVVVIDSKTHRIITLKDSVYFPLYKAIAHELGCIAFVASFEEV